MNKLTLCLGGIFLFAGFNSYAQEILTLKEMSFGKTVEIEGTANPIVDINSTIELSLSKQELRSAIRTQFPQLTLQATLEKEITALENALSDQNTILLILKQKVASVSEQEQFFELMDGFFNSIHESGLQKKVNVLFAQFYDQEWDSHYTYPEEFIFEKLTSELQELQQNFIGSELSQLKISLVAFKKDKLGGDRIHIENFDTYENREYKVIERWVTSLNTQNQEKLKKISKLSSENQILNNDIFSAIKFSTEKNFQDLECLKEQKIAFNKLTSDKEKTANLSQEVKEKAVKLNTGLGKLISMGDILEKGISKWNITTPFFLSEQFLDFYISNKNFKEMLQSNAQEIDEIAANIPELQDLRENVIQCVSALVKNLDTLKSAIELQRHQQANFIVNKNIGEEVMKFGLGNLPEKGVIDLKKIGARSNGDEIEINLMLRLPPAAEEEPEQEILLEQTNLSLQMIGLHSEVAVGLIMANTFEHQIENNINKERRFFYAPAASLLFKFGSRSSRFYNDFLNPGIGINFASPDFNIDGNPEFGTGIIITALQDILSIGLNYNVTLDVPYWFFGVNLPFNLPGIPVMGVGTTE